jgi:L-iditol 2-dehydrogenase
MKAAVYRGHGRVSIDTIETPQIGPGELLVRVEACGICHTDLKKIEYDLLPAPRIFGHETAGVVVATGEGVEEFQPGDSVVAFHHIPCQNCFYCHRKLYAQCPTYKKVGITAGYEPAGGGFGQYVRVFDWIVKKGVEKIPAGVPFETACLVEPVNTVHKAVVQLDPKPGDVVAILGQGPIGLMFTMLVHRTGARILATDTMAPRLALAARFGAGEAVDPRSSDVVALAKAMTEGRGADAVIVAASVPGIVEQAVRCSRPGARILMFSQTSSKEHIDVTGADLVALERTVFGVYSADVDLQKESSKLVFSGEIPVGELVSHCWPLTEIGKGIELALHPTENSLKMVVQPQRLS